MPQKWSHKPKVKKTNPKTFLGLCRVFFFFAYEDFKSEGDKFFFFFKSVWMSSMSFLACWHLIYIEEEIGQSGLDPFVIVPVRLL